MFIAHDKFSPDPVIDETLDIFIISGNLFTWTCKPRQEWGDVPFTRVSDNDFRGINLLRLLKYI